MKRRKGFGNYKKNYELIFFVTTPSLIIVLYSLLDPSGLLSSCILFKRHHYDKTWSNFKIPKAFITNSCKILHDRSSQFRGERPGVKPGDIVIQYYRHEL